MNTLISENSNVKFTRLFYLAWLTIFCIAFYIYSPAFFHNYAWDDSAIVFQQATYLRDDWLHYALTEPFYVSTNYYRPLTVLMLFADFRLGAANPMLSHAINLFIFFINALLVLLISLKIANKIQLSYLQKTISATLCLSFYLFHTSNIESVVWVSGRFDIMLTTFLLLGILADLTITSINKRIIFVSLSFLLAAFCKEMAVIFLPILLLWHYALEYRLNETPCYQYFQSAAFKANCKIYAGICITGCIYLIIRYLALGYILHAESHASDLYSNTAQQLATIFKATYLYIKLLLIPFLHTSIQYPVEIPLTFNDREVIYGVVLFLSLLTSLLLSKKYNALILPNLTLIVFIIAIMPVIHLLPMKTGINIIHERFLAFPITIFSFSIILVGSSIVNKMTPLIKMVCSFSILAWFFAGIISIYSIVPLWKNDLTLWTWTHHVTPYKESTRALALTLFRFQQYQAAYDLAETLAQKDGNILELQGSAMLALKNYKQAKELYQKAMRTEINIFYVPTLLANLAYLEILTDGDLEKVPYYLEESLQLAPTRARTLYYYALYHYKIANFEQSLTLLEQAIKYSAGETALQASYRVYLEKVKAAKKVYMATGELPTILEK